jgi:hypothetical protein
MNAVLRTAGLARIENLADDLGRLRRRFAENDAWTEAVGLSGQPPRYEVFILDRIAGHVEVIDTLLRPTAAQIAAMWAAGDEDAIEEAIRLVDAHARELHSRMGGRL